MTMRKKILILNGSHSEATLILKAKELGYYVVTTGNNPSLMGHSFSDEYICADYSDKEAILDLVQNNGIDSIVSCANDFGVITASYVAGKMGWKGHDTYQNANTIHKKDLFKNLLQRLAIRTPYSKAFDSKDEAIDYARCAQYPVIVKATDLTGGKGILRADNMEQAVFAIDNAFARSRAKRILIEEFIIGVQQSIDTFVINKKVVSSVSNDVFCPINPYLIQSEILPAKGIERIQDELHGFIEKMCQDLDLVDGMFTLQYIVRDGKPYIIEGMRRALGNQFLTVARAVNGFPWEEALIRAETGMDLSGLQSEPPMADIVGHHGIMATRNGIVRSYTIPPEIERHLFQKIDIIAPGEAITDYMNQRIAYIYYTYENREEAVEAVSHFNDRIKIEFED